jgi:hypothetical protein
VGPGRSARPEAFLQLFDPVLHTGIPLTWASFPQHLDLDSLRLLLCFYFHSTSLYMSYLRRTFVHLFIDLFIVGLIATLYVSNTPIDPAIWSRRSQETAGKVVQVSISFLPTITDVHKSKETVGNLGNLRPALVSLFVTLSTLGFTAILKQVWHWTSQETTTGAVQVS